LNPRLSILTDLQQLGPQLGVGLLTADMMNLSSAINLLESSGIRLLHFDVMDGRIWPKLTAGAPFMAGLRHNMLNDVHLLLENPENHVSAFADAGADMISFSIEYASDIGLVLDRIEKCQNPRSPNRSILRGVSLNPETPVSAIKPYLDRIDYVVLLAVGPNTGKQTFFADLPNKIATLRAIDPKCFITVDGGIRKDNVGEIAQLGINCLVTGSAVFDGKDAPGNLASMLAAL